MLEQIFLKVMDMSFTAAIIIGIVLIVRIFLKRFPKYISYALWSVVLFRLLCPYSFESAYSLVPDVKPVSYQYEMATDTVSVPEESGGENFSGIASDLRKSDIQAVSGSGRTDTDAKLSWQTRCVTFGKYVWVLGVCVMLFYSIVSMIKIRQKVSVSVRVRDNIYITEGHISPFVMGVFRPRIYLPDCLSEKEQEYIIFHERCHIRRLDPVIRVLAFLALSIHWFNPLVWVAFIISGKDMEMSCDEAVIRKMGENIRADYAQSLLALATGHRVVRGIPLAFGEGDTKSRVQNLAKFRKTRRWVLFVIILAVAILILCLVSNPKNQNTKKTQSNQLATEEASEMDKADDTYKKLTISTVDLSYSLRKVAMCSTNEGWALSTEDEILFTDSGIENFSVARQLESVSSLNDGQADLCTVDRQSAYVAYISEDGRLLVDYTTDGRDNWKQTEVTSPGDAFDGSGSAYISFSDKDHGYLLYCSSPAAGQMTKRLFYTENAGESFSPADDLSRLSGYPQGISFAEGTCYIAVASHGENAYLYEKESGTDQWKKAEVMELPEGVRYMDGFVPAFDPQNKSEGMLVLKVVGDDVRFLLLTTQDAGANWSVQGEIPLESVSGCFDAGEQQFYVIDELGQLYKLF